MRAIGLEDPTLGAEPRTAIVLAHEDGTAVEVLKPRAVRIPLGASLTCGTICRLLAAHSPPPVPLTLRRGWPERNHARIEPDHQEGPEIRRQHEQEQQEVEYQDGQRGADLRRRVYEVVNCVDEFGMSADRRHAWAGGPLSQRREQPTTYSNDDDVCRKTDAPAQDDWYDARRPS